LPFRVSSFIICGIESNMYMTNYKDIFVVETFEEAEEFRYEHNDKPVEIGTAVAHDRPFVGMPGDKAPKDRSGIRSWKMTKEDMPVMQLVCFEGIYYQSNEG
jgi:hypothetical protein